MTGDRRIEGNIGEIREIKLNVGKEVMEEMSKWIAVECQQDGERKFEGR